MLIPGIIGAIAAIAGQDKPASIQDTTGPVYSQYEPTQEPAPQSQPEEDPGNKQKRGIAIFLIIAGASFLAFQYFYNGRK